MKHMFLSLMFALIATSALSKTQNDTLSVNNADITRWIEEPYTNSKGKEAIHYYVIWKGYLVTTSKTTIEKIALCKKYGAKYSLIVIGQKQPNGTFKPKRITIY